MATQDPSTPGPGRRVTDPETDEPAAGGPVWARSRANWDQPAPRRRERPSLDAFVTAAIELADEQGLDASSVRRVAGVLDTWPMGLYAYVGGKDDLIDLMIDRVVGESLVPELPRHWRPALAAIAQGIRTACQAHPWLITSSSASRRPHIGPNALQHFEQMLAALDELDVDLSTKLGIIRTVDTHAMGFAQVGLAESRVRQDAADPRWREAAETYLAEHVTAETLPRLAAFGPARLLRRDQDAPSFETGLEWLLSGIAAELGL